MTTKQAKPATKKKKDIVSPKARGKVKPKGKIGTTKGHKGYKGPKRDTTRRLTDAEKYAIVAIQEQTGKVTKTAEMAGCSHSTVIEVVRQYKDTNPALVDSIKKGMTGKLHDVADRMVDHASNNISSLNAYQATIAAGVMLDKALLIERGAPPSQVNQIQVNVQLTQLQDEIAAMISKATNSP